MIVDTFAGPGGWDIAARTLGIETVGIEHDRDACATRGAAGLATIRADVSTWPLGPLAGRVDGLIASPPCQAFSLAGSQLGHLDLDRIYDAVRGWPEPWSLDVWNDPRSALILEPLRWAWDLRPRWVACEQVKPCLPVWRALGEKLAEVGYRWWAGILNSADFGVPQTRERAIFMASLDRQPQPPAATHARDPQPTLFGAPVERWVSMAEALTAKSGGQWHLTRPATTVQGDSRLWPPGHKVNGDDRARLGEEEANERYGDRAGSDAIRLSVEDALLLQSFPADYPVQGTKTAQFRQIGDAVPPLLAYHVLRAAT